MGDRTKIEWTDATWNPIRGCSRVSEGCRNCYAEAFAARFSGPGEPYEGLATMTSSGPRWTGEVRVVEEVLDQPLRWERPRMVFVNSMSDLFHEKVSDETIDRIFAVMALADDHTFQVLTKRPERMVEYMRDRDWGEAANYVTDRYIRRLDGPLYLMGEIVPPLHNVWLGVSVEDQKAADERIPLLLETPAAVRFVSCEPLLNPVNLQAVAKRVYRTSTGETWSKIDALAGRRFAAGHKGPWVSAGPGSVLPRLDWVIVGGESGPNARPFDITWAREIIQQCKSAGVPVFVKQLGSRPVGEWGDGTSRPFRSGHWRLNDLKGGDPSEWPEDLRVREWPERAEVSA